MFGLFKKKSELEKLQERYKTLQKESFELSKVNRQKSDAKLKEADDVAKKIDAIKANA
ncbi:MAG: Lacal_2735 family protein [Psychroflexus sp.]